MGYKKEWVILDTQIEKKYKNVKSFIFPPPRDNILSAFCRGFCKNYHSNRGHNTVIPEHYKILLIPI